MMMKGCGGEGEKAGRNGRKGVQESEKKGFIPWMVGGRMKGTLKVKSGDNIVGNERQAPFSFSLSLCFGGGDNDNPPEMFQGSQ
jgi:hypothetical protein